MGTDEKSASDRRSIWTVPGAWAVANVNRHVLRSFLANEGCPATIINAALGHALYGEGHWQPHSSFDPVRYAEAIAPYLERLLGQLRFQVLT